LESQDDALICIALACEAKAKILISPAMNGKIGLHATTQANVATFEKARRGNSSCHAGMLSCRL